MWVLHVGVCIVFLLLVAFWVGKKLGQRKFFKLESDMQALELSFKHLVDDIEMVANHNIKALDGQCNVIRELLTVADKKCLYANDLLKEIDDGVESLRKRNLNPSNALATIDQGLDKRFRKEVQDTLEEMLKKIVALNNRVGELEAVMPDGRESHENHEGKINPEELRSLIGSEVANYLQALEASFERYEPVAATVNSRISERTADRAADRAAELTVARSYEPVSERLSTPDKQGDRPVLRAVSRETPTMVAAHAPVPPVKPLVPLKELKPVAIDESVKLPAAVKKTDLCKNTSPAAPPANFRVNEVLRLYSEGFTLPQIARSLNMGKGEIELIIKIYGDSVSMRNVL